MLVFFILWLLILVAAWDKENEISFWSILLVFSVLIGFRSLTVIIRCFMELAEVVIMDILNPCMGI